MDYSSSGPIILLIGLIFSRMVMEWGYRTLTPEEKLRLMDCFSSNRAYALLPLLAIVGGYYYLATQTNLGGMALASIFFAVLLGYNLLLMANNWSKLSALQLPATYRYRFLCAQLISLLSLAWFMFAMTQSPR